MLIRFATITVLFLLTACSPFVSPPLAPPQLLPESYQSTPQSANPLPNRWWESFADPRLNRLQEEMLANNLDLQQALYRLEQLEALQRISGSSLWPTLTLSGSVSRDKTPSGSSENFSTTKRATLAASYEVDIWNRLHDKTEAARLRREAGEQETQALLLSLAAQLTEQYYLAVEQRAQLTLVEGQIDNYQELITTVGDRFRSGLATARELYQARQNLARAEALLPQFRTGITRAENSIALLLGRTPEPQLTQAEQLPVLTSAVEAGVPASLLTQRPDISAALTHLRAADLELSAALADRLPAVNLSATAYYSATKLAQGDVDGSFWTLALGLTQPLIDGGRREAESDRQRATRNERFSNYKKTILNAVQEVETALVADQNSALRQKWLQLQLQASHQELLSSHASYRYGLLSSQDLLTSEVRYLETSSLNIAAHRQWISNRITLARALGGSWMAEEVNKQQVSLKDTEDK